MSDEKAVEEETGISQKDAQNCLNVWTHCEESYSLAARELRIPTEEVRQGVDVAIEMELEPSEEFTKRVKYRGKMKTVPLSEHVKTRTASPEECIVELQNLQEEFPEIFITRSFFRNQSRLADSAWNGHFGTFAEYRKQAGCELSRAQHGMERHIARHAAADNYREMNIEKDGYGDKYEKPSGKRFQTYIALMDMHDRDCDPFYRRLAITAIKDIQPDVLILNGDIFDLYEFSSFEKDPRYANVMEGITWVHRFLAECREACPDMQIDFIEGNHEYRMMRHLADKTPYLMGMLADLHGLNTSKLLGLDEYEVNYITRSDLSVFNKTGIKKQIGLNWKIYDNCFIASHYPKDKDMGWPGFNGHHHKHLVTTKYNPEFGSYQWIQSGCGHKRNASYCDGERWSNGFLIIHADTEQRHTVFSYVDIKDFAVIGGKYFERTAEEKSMEF